MKIVFVGTPSFVVPVLESLINKFDVIAVITAPDQKVGRKQLLTPSPIKVFAEKNNIPVFNDLKSENVKEKVAQSDLLIVAAYGKLIPNDLLTMPKFGAINIHPSLLPHYRGPSPVQTAIANGDKETGFTFMKMDEQLDHGPLLVSKTEPISDNDTFETLVTRLFYKSAEVLPEVLANYISGKLKHEPQDESKTSYSKIIVKEDGYFELDSIKSEEAKQKVQRMIRAYYPWPTAWTLLRLKASEGQAKEKIIKFLPNQKLQLEGKKPVSLKDFLNGYPEMKEKIENIFDN